jgi:hypothetical protein
MPQYNGNGAFFSWNGVNVSAFWTEKTDLTSTNKPTKVTGGANKTHEEHNPGIDATAFKFNLFYDDTQATRAAHIASLKPGTKGTLIFGLQGNSAGMPVHEQVMIITDVKGPNVGEEKDEYARFEMTFLGAAAPVRNIYDDVFS